MSTRGMVGVRADGILKGTYNHSDSYPGCLGTDIVNFCRLHLDTSEKVDSFKNKVQGIHMVDSSDHPSDAVFEYYWNVPAEEGQRSMRDAIGGMDRAKAEFYGLLRNYQGVQSLDAVRRGELKHWIDSSSFIEDSLFCEYAYILDLDRGVLEFYEGFQQTAEMNEHGSPIYGPCKKVGELAFNMVTIEAMNSIYGEGESED